MLSITGKVMSNINTTGVIGGHKDIIFDIQDGKYLRIKLPFFKFPVFPGPHLQRQCGDGS